MALAHEVPERVQQALDQWAPFPVDRKPRPLVVLEPKARALGFPDGETKRAFLDGAIEAAPGFPRPVFDAIGTAERRSARARLVLTGATLEEFEFRTDRGPQTLPAWRVDAAGVQRPIWVLDPAVAPSIWEPIGWSPVSLSSAESGADGRTVTMAFVGSPADHADYPDARVYEQGAAVALVPIGVSKLPPERPRPAIGARREVTVVLPQPLGDRVLLDGAGHPVMVAGPMG